MVPFDTGLDKSNPPNEANRKKFLEEGIEAIQRGDIWGGLETFFLGHILDGLFRRLQGKWDGLSDDQIHDVLSQAILQLIEKVSKGDQVLRPIPYLLKVCNGMASDKWRYSESLSKTDMSKLPEPETLSPSDRSELKRKALSIAKGFLAQLGQENVQLVMEYIFDAIEKGVEDVSNREIGEALGLTPEVVRQSKSRGWHRLERIAKENDYHFEFRFLDDNNQGDEGAKNE